MGLAGLVDWGCVGLCQTSGGHASQEVTNHDASDPSVRLLESNDPAEAEHLAYGWGQLGLGNFLSHRDEGGGGVFIVQDEPQQFCREAGGAWGRPFACPA